MKVKAPANALIGLLANSPRSSKARAQKVFKAWFDPTANLDDDQEYEAYAIRLNASIAQNLDAESIFDFIMLVIKVSGTEKGRNAVNARHSRPGGARDKQSLIRKAWASGKFSSRDLCAEQECAALNMPFSTARKALRCTPNPR